jgi:DNA-binding GntR family transcriptional regulator
MLDPGSRMHPINRAQSQYLLARQIISYVRDNQLGRDHHLVETSLAEHFGVSRTLIRAALKRLAGRKVVEGRPNQGFFLLKPWDMLDSKIIDVPPTVDDDLYRRLVRDRISGKIPESINQVALVERYRADRGALLRVLGRMADEGIVAKNKGHGWTFLPTINTDITLGSSYDLRRTIEPNGILLHSFRIDPVSLERTRAAHLAVLARAETVTALQLIELDTEFHDAIASFTCNSFFIQIIQQHNRLRRLLEFRGYEDRGRVRTWLGEHVDIIDALTANNRALASELMTEHLDNAYRAAATLRRVSGNGRTSRPRPATVGPR